MSEKAVENKSLKPFESHGLDFTIKGNQGWAECPFCGEPKFCVNVNSGQWDCKYCDPKGGNIYSFFRRLQKESLKQTTTRDYMELCKNRRILSPDTFRTWGVCKSVATGDWLVPGYLADGKLAQLYRYAQVKRVDKDTGKAKYVYQLMVTEATNHQLHGVNLYQEDPTKENVILCEGAWDGMVVQEALRFAGKLTTYNVLAAPGSKVFLPSWLELFSGKNVYLLYDSDHPNKDKTTGKEIPNSSDGLQGMKRAYNMIRSMKNPPKRIMYIHWGDLGYDPKLKPGYDARDHFSTESTVQGRVKALHSLMVKMKLCPKAWNKAVSQQESEDKIQCVPCESWQELVTSWRKSMKWTDGLEHALSIMLSSVLSTNLIGDQLWIRVISPPSTGKTVLCEAISVNKEYCVAKSTIRGFHSGFRMKGVADFSLLAKIKGKTLITKDGDTLVTAPDKDRILAEARDVYDTCSRSDYRHGGGKNYEGYRTTWILAGTEALMVLDKSELGQRFLTCKIMDRIDDDLEEEICWKKVNQVDNNRHEANGTAEGQLDPLLLSSYGLTGGYVGFLRQRGVELYTKVSFPDDAKRACIMLGKLVSYMRARPSVKQDEVDTREMSVRLVSQMAKLAVCLAVVKGQKEVNHDIVKQVAKVAFDSSSGKTLDITKYLFKKGEEGAEPKVIIAREFFDEKKGAGYMKYLRKIGVVEVHTSSNGMINGQPKYRLTKRLNELYKVVLTYTKTE